MKLWLEIPAFGALAAGLHLAIFAAWPAGAPGAAGDGGAGTLTLSGQRGAVAEMVAAWEAPPQTAEPAALKPIARETGQASAPSPDALPDRRVVSPLSDVARDASLPNLPDAPRPLPTPDVAASSPAPAPPTEPAAPAAPSREAPPHRGDTPAGPQAAEMASAPPAPHPTPSPPQRPAARPAQVAAGAGDGALRGVRGEAATPGLSESARRSIVASWGAEIRARIEARKVHPEGMRASGRPVVRITVARSGALVDVRVVQSSRIAALDEAALRAVRRAGRFPAAPGELDLARVSFDLPISFTR